MKTRHLIIITALLASNVPFKAGAQFAIGTRHGIAISTLSKPGDLCDNDNLTASYTGGLFVNIPMVKQLSLQPEINYIRKGRCDENNPGNNVGTTCNYNYLQIPVLARYTRGLGNSSKSSLFFNAGPYSSLLLKTDNHLANGDEVPASQVKEDKKTPDFGLVMGGGVIFPVKKVKIQFDLRYDLGLTKLDNQPSDYRTKSLSIAAGILF
jgi:hypothetical protein